MTLMIHEFLMYNFCCEIGTNKFMKYKLIAYVITNIYKLIIKLISII